MSDHLPDDRDAEDLDRADSANIDRRGSIALLLGITTFSATTHFGGDAIKVLRPPSGDFSASPEPALGQLQEASIMTDGWRLSGKFAGLAPGGIVPLTGFKHIPASAYFVVTGRGWNTNGDFSTAQFRTIRANDGVRRMWEQGVSEPQTFASTPYVLDAIGTDLYFELGATRHIFSQEMITLNAVSGWISDAIAVVESSVANVSTLLYPKGMIDWLEPQREQVRGKFKVRLTGGFHLEGRGGRPFAAVKVTATPWDPITNTQKANAQSKTVLANYEVAGQLNVAGRVSAVWAAEFEEADFPPGLVLFSFEDCPWVGDSSSQRSNETLPPRNPRSISFNATGIATSIGRGLHSVMKWLGPISNQRHVYVAAPGNALGIVGDDATGSCQLTMEQAQDRAFATFDAAWRALFDPQKFGQLDASGSIVWLSDGRFLLPPDGFTGPQQTRRANDIAVVIQPDARIADPVASCELRSSGATRYQLFGSTTGKWTSFIIFRKISLTWSPNNIGLFTSGGTRASYFYFDGCRLSNESNIIGIAMIGGSIVAARDSVIRKTGVGTLFETSNSSGFALHFFNCESNVPLNANVLWGVRYPDTINGATFNLGQAAAGFIRNDNLVAGYIYAPSWEPTKATVFLRQQTPAQPWAADWGISVAYSGTRALTGSAGSNSRFLKMGELITQSYRNFVMEAVTTTKLGVDKLDGVNGVNFHNDPLPIPTAQPGNEYDRCVIRNSNLVRIAVKGPLFYAVNGNGVPKPEAAKFLTGGRSVRQGVGMHGLLVGSRSDNNALHCDGLFSLYGSEKVAIKPSYADESAGDFRPTGGFVPIAADLIGHGFDINGSPLWLDGTDAPGAFKRA